MLVARWWIGGSVDLLGLDYYPHSEWFYDDRGGHAPSPEPVGLARYERVAGAADPELVTVRRLAILAINRIRRAQAESARGTQEDSAPPPLPVPDSIVPVVPAGGGD